jgi:hypothetical protein
VVRPGTAAVASRIKSAVSCLQEISAMSIENEPAALADETPAEDTPRTSKLRVIGWFSMGMAAAAVGIFLGRELLIRYKFKRRTPYDFYSNSAEQQASEFGMGI